MFERAGDYFVRGKVDPRLVVRLFPAFRGKVIGSAEEVEMLEGVRPVFADMSTIDHISGCVGPTLLTSSQGLHQPQRYRPRTSGEGGAAWSAI